MSIIKKERVGSLIGLIVVIVVLTVGCAGAVRPSLDRPNWIDSLYDANYNEKTYICAVGAGSTRENAINAAFSSLSQVFHTQVDSTLSFYGVSSASTLDLQETMYSDSESMIDQSRLSSKTERLVGGEVVNTWIAKDGTVWVRVAVNRKKTAEVYTNDMATLEKEINRIRFHSAQGPTPLTRFFRLLGALQPAMAHQELSEQVGILTGKSRSSLLQNIEHELDTLASTITIALESKVVVPEAERAVTTSQVLSAFSALFTDFGFNVVTTNTAKYPLVTIEYSVAEIEQTGGRYVHVRYALSVQVKEGGTVLATYQKNQRETALTPLDARQRALRLALNDAIQGLSLALAGQ